MSEKVKNVWVIDNDPTFTFIIKRLFELIDFCDSLSVYGDAEEALKLIQNNTQPNELPNLLLVDINMPIFDGWQFLDELGNEPAIQDMTIYLVSSSVDPRDGKKMRTYSYVKDLLIKPITEEQLNSIKKELLQGIT